MRRPRPRSNCTWRSRVVCRRLRLCASAQRPATVELWQLAVRRRRVGHSGGSRRRVGHRSALRRSFDSLAFGAARPHGPGGPGRQDHPWYAADCSTDRQFGTPNPTALSCRLAGLQVLIFICKKTLYCTRIVIFLFIYLFMGDFLLFQFVFVSLFNRPLISNLASIACDYTI